LTALGAVTAHHAEAGLESATLMRRGKCLPAIAPRATVIVPD